MKDKRKISHSQNFIRNNSLVNELLSMTNISSKDLVIEIGPGNGIITTELLGHAGKVIAIERDTYLAKELIKSNKDNQLEVIQGNFLVWELPTKRYKVFSNIPFNYTADIVNKLISADVAPEDMFLIMQEAAAHRFIGLPFTRNSLTSILLSVDFSVNILRKIDQNNFAPKPNVTITFVHFHKKDKSYLEIAQIPESEEQLFRDFIVFGYTQWAPTILKAYEDVFSRKQLSIISNSQKLKGLKPTDLDIDQWASLYKTFSRYAKPEKQQIVMGSEKRLINQQDKLDKINRTK